MAKKPPKKKIARSKADMVIASRKAKRALGLHPSEPLPRCGHWSRVKATRIMEETGDASHMAKGHVCEQCMCTAVAGSGTEHLGVGWCHNHEKCNTDRNCKRRADAMTRAIREGYPNRVFAYRSNSDRLAEIQAASDESKELISMRDNQILVVDLVQRLLTYFETGVRDDGGVRLTESYKEGPDTMSDATLLNLLRGYLEVSAKLSKAQLEVTSQEFCLQDDVNVFFAEILRIVKSHTDEEIFATIFNEVVKLNQPQPGRKK